MQAQSNRINDVGRLTEKEEYYRGYFRMFLGGAVGFGLIAGWFADIGNNVSQVTCDIITLICLFMTVICYHSYKETERSIEQLTGDSNGKSE